MCAMGHDCGVYHLPSVGLKIDVVQAADVRVELEGRLRDDRVTRRDRRPRGRRVWGRWRRRRRVQRHNLDEHRWLDSGEWKSQATRKCAQVCGLDECLTRLCSRAAAQVRAVERAVHVEGCAGTGARDRSSVLD